jgi:excisionase family DNA binding protein
MSEELLSPAQAAEIAVCHNDTVRRAIEAGFLPAQRVGRNWIIKREDVEAWIKAGRPNRRRGTSYESEVEEENSPEDSTGKDQ